MPRAVFVTGAGGFVGRRLIGVLQQRGRRVYALDRSGKVSSRLTSGSPVTVVSGDLLHPESYRRALGECDVVLHLAAATGRAAAEEHERTNARGTETLVAESRRAGVRKFVFVSSIATTFPDTTGYAYAQTKARAETAVRESGLAFAILRPAIILGPGSPILNSLEKLATLPVAVLPGPGLARVQPVHVDDAVRFILAPVDQESLTGVFEIGGPEVVTLEGLMRRLRQARRGTQGPLLHLPLPLLQVPLRMLEAAGLGRMLPISAGQLTSFRFDGLAQPNPLQQRLQASLLGLDDMLAGDAERPGAATAPNLSAECVVFTQHLLGCRPTDYVIAKYEEANEKLPTLAPADRFDAWLVGFAASRASAASLADSYAAVFVPASALRKKLVILLAILETCPPFHQDIDDPVRGGRWGAVAGIGLDSARALFTFMAGALIIVPARVVLSILPKGAR